MLFRSILDAAWPEVDNSALVSDEIKYMIQINGKLRGQFTVPVDAGTEDIKKAALANPDAVRFIDGKEPRKIIVVPKKLVNIVV